MSNTSTTRRKCEPTSKVYIPKVHSKSRYQERENMPLVKYESMPVIITPPKHITSKSRSVSLNDISIRKCTSNILSLTCRSEIKSTKILSNHLDNLNENISNRFHMMHDVKLYGFSSEWDFHRKYDSYIKKNCIGLPKSEDSTISEKSILSGMTTETPHHTIQSSNEMQGPNKRNNKNVMQLSHEENNGNEENSSNDEYTVVSYSESLDSSKDNVSEEIQKTKDDETLLLLGGKTDEKSKTMLRDFNILGIILPESKTYSKEKLTDQMCADTELPIKLYTPEMLNLYEQASDDRYLKTLNRKSAIEKGNKLFNLDNTSLSLREQRIVSEQSLVAKFMKFKLNGSVPHPKRKHNSEITDKNVTERENSQFECICDLLKPESEIDSIKETLNICDLVISESEIAPLPKFTCETSTRNSIDMERKTYDAGILALLEGKTFKQKQNILKALVMLGIRLPINKTISNESVIINIGTDVALPSKSPSSEMLTMYENYANVKILQRQSAEINDNTLSALHTMNLSLLKYYTNSEVSLVNKITSKKLPLIFPIPVHQERKNGKKTTNISSKSRSKILMSDSKIDFSSESSLSQVNTSQEICNAKYEELLLHLEGKLPKQKEKILHELAMLGIHLTQENNTSGNRLISRIGTDFKTITQKRQQNVIANEIEKEKQPLEGKIKQKEEITDDSVEFGITLVKQRSSSGIPLADKTDKYRTNHTSLNTESLQLPEGKTKGELKIGLDVSLRNERRTLDRALVNKIEAGDIEHPEALLKTRNKLYNRTCKPITYRSYQLKSKSEKLLCQETSYFTKINTEKEITNMLSKKAETRERNNKNTDQILQLSKANLLKNTTSPWLKQCAITEKSFLANVDSPNKYDSLTRLQQEKKINAKQPSTTDVIEVKPSLESSCTSNLYFVPLSSEKMRHSKEVGLLPLLEGESPKKKENILKGLALLGMPLPEGKTNSEKKLIDRVRTDLGLPPAPKTVEMKKKYAIAAVAGFLQPLEGKTQKQKEIILRGLANMCIPLPKGRSYSEKALIYKIATIRSLMTFTCSEQIHKESEKFKIQKNITTKCDPSSSECTLNSIQIASPAFLSKTSKESISIQNAKLSGLFIPLADKSPEQKQMIFKELAIHGIMLPESKTNSDMKLIIKVRKDLGLPPEPQTAEMREKYEQAAERGMLWPLEGKNQKEKEKILKDLVDLGIPLPKGRSASERALIIRIKSGHSTATCRSPVLLQAKRKLNKNFLQLAARENLNSNYNNSITNLATSCCKSPHENKPPNKKLKTLKGLDIQGIVLPDKKLIDQVCNDLGIPSKPETAHTKVKYACKGLFKPLEGKRLKEKGKDLKSFTNCCIPLPTGGCCSEHTLVNKIETKRSKSCQVRKFLKKLTEPESTVSKYECVFRIPGPSKTIMPMSKNSTMTACYTKHKVKCDRLLTSLENLTPEKKKQILKQLAIHGINLPEGNTNSDKQLIDKVRSELGLPPSPQTAAMRDKYEHAAEKGLLQPLNGKALKQKEKILKGLINFGIPLPKGRCASERALIKKVKDRLKANKNVCDLCAKRLSEQKFVVTKCDSITLEKKGSASLPKVCYSSERPLERKTSKAKKSNSRDLIDLGTPLSRGCCTSETTLVKRKKVKSSTVECQCEIVKSKECIPNRVSPCSSETRKLSSRRQTAKNAGFLTPLQGKTPARCEIGTQESLQIKGYNKAQAIGIIVPLEGKTTTEKKAIMQQLHDAGIHLTEGKTPSKALLINEIKKGLVRCDSSSSIKDKKASKEPPKFHCPKQKRSSEGKSKKKHKMEISQASDLPRLIKKNDKAQAAGIIIPLEGKTTAEKKRVLQQLYGAGIGLPVGRTCSEQMMINEIKAQARTTKIEQSPGSLSPLISKALKQKDKITKVISDHILPRVSDSITRLNEKIKPLINDKIVPLLNDKIAPLLPDRFLSLLSTSRSSSSHSLSKGCSSQSQGMLVSLKGKTSTERKKILELLQAVKCCGSDIVKKTKKGLISRLEDKILKRKLTSTAQTPCEYKNTVECSRMMKGNTDSCSPADKSLSAKLYAKSRRTKQPTSVTKNPSLIAIYDKPPTTSIKVPSNRDIPSKEKKNSLAPLGIKMCPSKRSSFIVDLSRKCSSRSIQRELALHGITAEEKEKMLKDLVKLGFSLPISKTPFEKKVLANVRRQIGLPPEPSNPLARHRYELAQAAGLILPLEDRTSAEKKKILQQLHNASIPLPEARTPSEELIIKEIQRGFCFCFQSNTTFAKNDRTESQKTAKIPSYLENKTLTQSERIIKDMIRAGSTFPIANTLSEALLTKAKREASLPPETENPQIFKCDKAHAVDIILPFKSNTTANNATFLQQKRHTGIPLSEKNPPLEEFMVNEIQKEYRKGIKRSAESQTICEFKRPVQKDLITGIRGPLPLPEMETQQSRSWTLFESTAPARREKALKDLLNYGFSLPIPKTLFEKQLLANIRRDTGLPPEPESTVIKDRYEQAQAAGIILPLAGRTYAEKKKILQQLHDAKVSLPVGRTPSEKFLIAEITKASGNSYQTKLLETLCPLQCLRPVQTEKNLQKPISGTAITNKRTNPKELMINKKGIIQAAICCSGQGHAQSIIQTGIPTSFEDEIILRKEKLLKDLLISGFSLPMSKTPSEKFLLAKIRLQTGLPPEPECPTIKERYCQAQAAGIILPLEGRTSADKTKILNQLYKAGIPLPKGRTPSEESMINKIKRRSIQSGINVTHKYQQSSVQGDRFTNHIESKGTARKKQKLKELLECGFALPIAKTISEKQLLDKVKYDTSEPCELKSTSHIRSSNEPQVTESILPPEIKGSTAKKNILQRLNDTRLNLSKGQIFAEKIINKELKQKSIQVDTPWQQRAIEKLQLLSGSKSTTEKTKENILTVDNNKLSRCPCGRSSKKSILIKKHSVQSETTQIGPKSTGVSLSNKSLSCCNCWPPKKSLLHKNIAHSAQGLSRQIEQNPIEATVIDKRLSCYCSNASQKSLINKINKHSAQRLTGQIQQKSTEMSANDKRSLCSYGENLQKSIVSKTKKHSAQHLTQQIKKKPTEVSVNDKLLSCCCSRASQKSISKTKKHSAQRLTQQLEQKPTELSINDKLLTCCCSTKHSQKSIINKINKHSAQRLYKKIEQKSTEVSISDKPLSCCCSQHSQKSIINNSNKNSTRRLTQKIKHEPKEVSVNCKPLSCCSSRPSQKLINNKINKHSSKRLTEQIEQRPAKASAKDKPLSCSCSRHSQKSITNKTITHSAHPLTKEIEQMPTKLSVNIKLSPYCPICRPSKKLILNDNKHSTQFLIKQIQQKPTKVSEISAHTENKTLEQKENLLKGLIIAGLPLPIAKTFSQKVLIDKVRREACLPLESKKGSKQSAASFVKASAQDKGLSQKPNDSCICQPKDLRKSSLSTVNKNKNTSLPCHAPLKRPKAAEYAGIPTLLDDRTAMYKEQNLKRLVKAGLPLPIGKTPSEKKTIDKIRYKCGLPPVPNTPALRKKYIKAQAAGLITPLEGKTASEKKKILQKLWDAGIPLPEGRTPSEEFMINTIKEYQCVNVLGSNAKIRPMTSQSIGKGKTIPQKVSYMSGQVSPRLPSTAANTLTIKENIDKIRLETGLPAATKTLSATSLYKKAQGDESIESFKRKSVAKKKSILRSLHDAVLALPKGRQNSEKDLIHGIEPQTTKNNNLKSRFKAYGRTSQVPDKSLREKEMRKLVSQGLPLPESKTRSDQKLSDTIRKELGLPPEPHTAEMKIMYEKGYRTGIIKPLDGLTSQEKECILRSQISMGIPLPKGRTSSEKSLIARIKREVSLLQTSSSRKLGNKKASYKSSDNKERIIQSLAGVGIYIPLEEKSSNELQNIQKNLARAGYISPEYSSSSKMSLVTAQEQRMLRDLLAAGIPLPKNLTPSEKTLIKSLVLHANTAFNYFRPALSARISNTFSSKPWTRNEKEYKPLVPTIESRLAGEIPSEKKYNSTYKKFQTEIKPLKCKTLQKNKRILQNVHEIGISSSEKEIVLNQIQTHFFQKYSSTIEAESSTYKLSADIEALKTLEQPLADDNCVLYRRPVTKNSKKLGILPDCYTTMNELHCKCPRTGIHNALHAFEQKKNMLQINTMVKMLKDERRSTSEKVLVTSDINDERIKLDKAGYFITSKNKVYYEKRRGIAVSELNLPLYDNLTRLMMIGNVKDACRIQPSPDIDVHQAQANQSYISGINLNPKSSTIVNTNTNLEPCKTFTPLENVSGKSRRIKHLEAINFVKCGNTFHNYTIRETKLKQKHIKIYMKSPESALCTQRLKEYVPEVPENIVAENDGIKFAVETTNSISSDSLCSRDSLLVVLKTDITHFNTLIDESDSYSPTEYNSNQSGCNHNGNESELCLKLTKYCNSTDKSYSTCSSSSVDLNPRITIYFSSHTQSNLTGDTFSGDSNNSIRAMPVSNDSSTNTQYYCNEFNDSNNIFAKTERLVNRRNPHSACAIVRSTDDASNKSSKYNIKSMNGNKSVTVIYTRSSKQSIWFNNCV